MENSLKESACNFFDPLNEREDMQELLFGLEQTIRFIVEDGESFELKVGKGRLSVLEGIDDFEAKDHVDFTHFRTDERTIRRLLASEIRYSDAVIPSGLDMGKLKLVEKWMFKKGIINWLGQVIRMGQEGQCWQDSRPTEGWKY